MNTESKGSTVTRTKSTTNKITNNPRSSTATLTTTEHSSR